MTDRTLAERLTQVIRHGRIVEAGRYSNGDGTTTQFVQVDTGNGWGVSVVRGGISYGADSGLWEAALTYGAPDWLPAHDEMREHEQWGDVRGWLTPQEVGEIINQVMAYPPPKRK